MGFSFPAGHIESYFADDCLRSHNVDSIDARKIDTANPYELLVEWKCGRIALGFFFFRGATAS